MSIDEQLTAEMKDGMRNKDKDPVACIRQVKAKLQEAVNAPNFNEPVDDALLQKVIGTYCKSMQKGIDELASAGDRSRELRDKYQTEITYLSQFLPKKLSLEETRALVQQIVAKTGAKDPKDSGRVMGVLMKEHRDSVDAGMAKTIVQQLLSTAEVS